MTETRTIAGATVFICAFTALGLTVTQDRVEPPLHTQSLLMISDAAPCQPREWTSPAPLLTPSSPTRRVARSASIAGDTGNLYVVGNDVLFWDQPVKVGEALTAWRVGHGSIGAPARDLVFASPKAVLDTTGRLHVLWGEPATKVKEIAPYKWAPLGISSIWWATYDPRRGWSQPARIYSGPVAWSDATIGTVSSEANDKGLVVAPIERGGVLLLELHNGKWDVTPIVRNIEPVYASVVALAERRLLALVAADTPEQDSPGGTFYDVNSVLLHSEVRRGVWRPWKRIQRSGEHPAYELAVLQDSRGRVHLVWRQSVRENYFVIRHVQSDDNGDSWTEPSDLTPGGTFQKLRAIVDACGALHVVYEDWSEGPDAIRIGYAIREAEWSSPRLLHPGYVVADVALHRRADGMPILTMLGTARSAGKEDKWGMLYAEFR